MNVGDDEDYAEEGSSEVINFPEEVQKAIDQVIPSADPLDQPDFDPVNYINSIFPTEQSLSNLDEFLNKMETEIRKIDGEIRSVVRGQTTSGMDGRAALEDAHKVMRQLFAQITDIKSKAEQSEETVREITRDIKQLDCAKKNLTSAITTLNHLHMLTGGVEALKNLTSRRQYGEIVMPLEAVTEVMKHFEAYKDIPQIRELGDQVREIQTSLSRQIMQDFRDAFTGPNAKTFVPNRQLAEACLVVSILDPKAKKDLLKWFVNLQLSEYQVLFHESEDNAWLDKLDRRYVWFKKHLLQCEDKFGAMFPPNWEVSERITVEFCNLTRGELSRIMAKRTNEIDVKLLLFAIQKTVALENLLAKRFSGCTLTEDAPSPVTEKPAKIIMEDDDDEDKGETKTKIVSPFTGIISECFQPYLSIYIDSLDRNMAELLDRSIADAKADFSREGLPGQSIGVLSSCADLFVFYKKCLVQCNQLSNANPMLLLAGIFQKYLREYASKVLQNNLPKVGVAASSLGTSVTNITRDLRDLSTGLIQNFLKEGEAARFTKSEEARICCILTTAEYCLETTQQLEKTLKDKIEPALSEKINLSQEQDVFNNVISNCIQLLVQDLELACEPSLTVMSKTSWQNVESVGDQSPYVSSITTHLKTTVPLIRDNLASSRKYFTQFCIKFVNSFIPKFIHSIYKCKPLSTAGAEQLLLDAHSLKTVLLGLPMIGSQVIREAPQSFTKIVVKGMTRAEMILKVVMSETDESRIVDQFVKLLPESDIQEFQKVLEMKGLNSKDKNHLLTLFKQKRPNQQAVTLPTTPKHDTSNIQKLNNLIKKTF
ncbi:hypothetical protein GE061_003212 [Apolygus lucorum]|uniref:Vacuolar protein sorting-associated protein 53 homolog n=1 Tax=Apolygus lucorum TaxID=248454 RepID=A0A8S9X2W6_APOLU|nr:hypothetical protein GE061_003212 [Apolygus lucorum]